MTKTAVQDLLDSTDLIAELLDENGIDFENFDAQEFLRDSVPVMVDMIVDEVSQRVYRRIRDEYLNADPNNSGKMRAYFDGMVDPDFDDISEDELLDV